jgi:hypothetical protein
MYQQKPPSNTTWMHFPPHGAGWSRPDFAGTLHGVVRIQVVVEANFRQSHLFVQGPGCEKFWWKQEIFGDFSHDLSIKHGVSNDELNGLDKAKIFRKSWFFLCFYNSIYRISRRWSHYFWEIGKFGPEDTLSKRTKIIIDNLVNSKAGNIQSNI